MTRILLCILVFSLFVQCAPKSNHNNPKQQNQTEQTSSPQSAQQEENETTNEIPVQKEVPIIEEGTTWSLFNSNGEEVKITVKNKKRWVSDSSKQSTNKNH